MKKIIPIIRLASKFTTIHRAVLNSEGRLENDTEHSYQLALVCWATNHAYKFGLSDELLLKFALVHDLVEVYAGDTDSHGDKEKIAAKKENEAKAFAAIKHHYAEHADLLQTIDDYQTLSHIEAQLVYVMDKLLPSINIFDRNDPYCQERKLDIVQWKQWMFAKVKPERFDPKLQKFFEQSIAEIERNYSAIFYQQPSELSKPN